MLQAHSDCLWTRLATRCLGCAGRARFRVPRMVDQETVMIGCIPQKQSAVKTVGLLHKKSRDHIGSDAAQLLARSFMGHPLGMHPPVPSMEIGVDTTQPLPSTHRSLATDLKWPESQVIPPRQCIPCLASRQRLCPWIRTDNLIMSSFFKRHPVAQAILSACAQVRHRSRN